MSLTVYVAADGDNAWPGTKARPVASLARARDLLRRHAGRRRRIVVRGGTYYDAALELTPEDSHLTIAAAAGERVVLYGGRRVTGWRKAGRRFYAAELDGVRAGRWDFRALLVGGEMRPRARWPEQGELEHESLFRVPWMSTTGGGWKRKPTRRELTTMVFRRGDLGAWLTPADAELQVFHQWDESLVGVRSVDLPSRTVRFRNPAGHPPGAFGVRRYVVWNVRRGMTRPGQWYLDRAGGRLVYWPREGEDMARVEVVAPTVESVIRLSGCEDRPVEGVTIRGLTIRATTTPLVAGGFGAGRFDGAVHATFARRCRLEGLTVCHVGGQGMKLEKCDDLRVRRCRVHHTGAGGIVFSGRRVVVEDCRVHHVGRTYPSGIAIRAAGSDHRVRHNDVHDTPYSAVTASGSGTRIEHNRFHRYMQVLKDGAAVYVTFCQGIRIRGNVARGRGTDISHGYYLDEQAERCAVEDNLAVDVGWPLHNHMAWNNVIRRNVLVDRGDSRMTLMKCRGFVFAENVWLAGGAIRVLTPPEGLARMPRNVLFSRRGRIVRELLEGYGAVRREPLLPAGGTVFADPLLADPRRGDCRFRPGSPARRLGLRVLDVSGAGVRP